MGDGGFDTAPPICSAHRAVVETPRWGVSLGVPTAPGAPVPVRRWRRPSASGRRQAVVVPGVPAGVSAASGVSGPPATPRNDVQCEHRLAAYGTASRQ